ncbi:MAG: isochorismate synthase [Acidobacteriota bacterium]
MTEPRSTAQITDLSTFLADAVEHLRKLGTGAFITLPAPHHAAPEAIWRLDPAEPALLWDRPGLTAVGSGDAIRLQVGLGAQRLSSLHDTIDARLSAMVIVRHPGARTASPTLWGGASFASDAPVDEPWAPFGAGQFVLPRWTYLRDERGASLSLALCNESDFAQRDQWLHEFSAIHHALTTPLADTEPLPGLRHVSRMPRESWAALVEEIKRGIREGRFDKVVLARRSRLRFEAAVDPVDVLRRLARRAEGSGAFRFGFRREGCTFVGLTPELLVAKQGRSLRSEALAGSAPSSPDPTLRAERRAWLLGNTKDLGEHRVVVDELRRRLRPLAADLDIPEYPRVREMPEILHLHTPIRATLDTPLPLFALADVLGPTPSVGGHPSRAALEFLQTHEPVSRGWYAGPIGWVDAEGNGEIAVAIRSALIDGDEALLFAGAGIVRDSEPDAEYEETAVKERNLLSALGISG